MSKLVEKQIQPHKVMVFYKALLTLQNYQNTTLEGNNLLVTFTSIVALDEDYSKYKSIRISTDTGKIIMVSFIN